MTKTQTQQPLREFTQEARRLDEKSLEYILGIMKKAEQQKMSGQPSVLSAHFLSFCLRHVKNFRLD